MSEVNRSYQCPKKGCKANAWTHGPSGYYCHYCGTPQPTVSTESRERLVEALHFLEEASSPRVMDAMLYEEWNESGASDEESYQAWLSGKALEILRALTTKPEASKANKVKAQFGIGRALCLLRDMHENVGKDGPIDPSFIRSWISDAIRHLETYHPDVSQAGK